MVRIVLPVNIGFTVGSVDNGFTGRYYGRLVMARKAAADTEEHVSLFQIVKRGPGHYPVTDAER